MTSPSVIAAGARFEGLLVFNAHARVEGELVGAVSGGGLLEVAPGARVEGDVEVQTLLVEGELHGDVRGCERILVGSEALIRARIETAALEVSEGARIEGPVTMTGSASAND